MIKKNQILLELIFESLYLAVMVLQSYSLISYYYFISKLKENESKLLITFTKIRSLNRAKKNNGIYDIYSKQKLMDFIEREDIKDVIVLLSKILNFTYSQEQFEKIYSYYLTENNQENIYILNHLQIDFEDTNIFNNSFIFDSEERFTLLFWKNSKKYSKKTYPRILYFYLKKGIFFLNIYKNLK